VLAPDGRIDRKALGAKVFGKPAELRKLTDIVWPAIRALAAEEIARVRAMDNAPVIVLEAAVLFEAGWDDLGDEVWVNIVDRDVAIARAMQRDNLARETVESRLDSQLSNAERIARADVVIATTERSKRCWGNCANSGNGSTPDSRQHHCRKPRREASPS
jgi:dephospho-CoA kinase